MEIKVRMFGDLIPFFGNERQVVLEEPAGIEDLIKRLNEITPNSQKIKRSPNLTILLNGRNVGAMKQPVLLNDGDVVAFLPPFVGG